MTPNIMLFFAILMAVSSYCMAGVLPAVPLAAAPVIAAPASIGYAHAVPQNVPPFASRIDINTRALASPYISAPYVSAPYVNAPYVNAPYAVAPAPVPSSAIVAAPGAYGPVVVG